jgi:hypothetical protein
VGGVAVTKKKVQIESLMSGKLTLITQLQGFSFTPAGFGIYLISAD